MNTQFKGVLYGEETGTSALAGMLGDYEAMVWWNLQLLIERYGRRADYRWVDMKLNLITGEDFSAEDAVKGHGAIYGWIQGRAMEALAGHGRRLKHYPSTDAIRKTKKAIQKILREVIESIQDARSKNGGHLYFLMNEQGRPLRYVEGAVVVGDYLTEGSAYNYSDLFSSKGLYAAGFYLNDRELAGEGRAYCEKVYEAILGRTFYLDQEPLNPKNPVQNVPGRYSQGPYMIQLGAAALLTAYEEDAVGVEMGLTLIRYLFEHHLNLGGRWGELEPFDFVEFIDDDGQPWREADGILSDPGHALELVGLAMKFTLAVRQRSDTEEAVLAEIKRIEGVLFDLFRHYFELGYCEGAGGIYKSMDLLSRKPVNSQLPWWSVVETIRAAAECLPIAAEKQKAFFSEAWGLCHHTLVTNYVRRDRHLMCVQTRSSEGEVIDAIPGTADADPGYHTGLSLIDCLK